MNDHCSLGVIGCGDVAYRRYFPALDTAAPRGRIVACCDARAESADRAATYLRKRGYGTQSYTDFEAFLQHPDLDAVVNLTPVSCHFALNLAVLEAGKHVYCEKPLGDTPDEAQSLIDAAKRQELLLMSAPAVMATARFAWLRTVLADGLIGQPTVITAQFGNLGPAAWDEYTGDPVAFYRADVGPMRDQGIYLLHGITGLLGPATRVQAMSARTIPSRTVLYGGRAGEQFDIETDDVVSLQLQFDGAAIAQVLSSVAIPATRVPIMEIHGSAGTISIADFLVANNAVELFSVDDQAAWPQGWSQVVPEGPASPTNDLIGLGAVHFVQCLVGEQEPRLIPEHALHVMEIMAAAQTSALEGRAVDLTGAVWKPE